MIRIHRHLAVWASLLLIALLATCRGNATDPLPTAAVTAAVAATPSPRPDVTPTATPAQPFPAPAEDTSRADSDPTLPTRTPTPPADGAAVLPAPVCNGLTPATAEGPHYLPNTPERSSLREAGMPGDPLLLTGYVLDANCAPIPGAWLDFWQADAGGIYDSASFRLRGHQFTDADGRFRLDTILPGPADGRPRHLYVKAQAPGGPVLNTQLFFPDDPTNAADPEFRPELLLTFSDAQTAAFDFVIPMP